MSDSPEEIFFTGDELKKAVFDVKPLRETYIQSLIPKKSTTMWFASDGAGKSTVTLQALLEASNGLDVFGGFSSKPIKSAIIMTERPREETFERIQSMSPVIDINWNNIIVDDSFMGLDLLVPKDFEKFYEKIMRIADRMQGLDLIHIDTVYGLVSEGLSNEKPCGQVNKMLRKLQVAIGSSNSYTHHTNRGARNSKNNQREAEDMYGNRFLRANCTGVFKIVKNDTGTIITNEKDTLECLSKEINLKFDSETYISLMDIMHTTKFHSEKLVSYIHEKFRLKKDFSFDEMRVALGVSVSYLRDQFSVHLKSGQVINLKPKGEKALYRALRDF